MTEPEPKPAWMAREQLIRQARESIDGRASFEKHMGRPSVKPLTITIDPRDLLAALQED